MGVDEPDVVAEVAARFEAYEAALVANDVDALVDAFWDDAATVRFGVREELYGWGAITAYRRTCAPVGRRELLRTRITAFGRDAAVVSTEFREQGVPGLGRQSQTWVRLPAGWRIVHAHVSLPAAPRADGQ